MPMQFSVGRIFVRLRLKVKQLLGIKIRTRESNAKRFDLIKAISRKIKGVSEIRIQILAPHPEMHLVTIFGTLAPSSSVPEGTSSTRSLTSSGNIQQSYWNF
ncbi:hypothetical protein TNCV_4106981 [Trichonephila clavipes]|nr:hypothetical protein TNCV_4106981 [Trichonephila clavipes]